MKSVFLFALIMVIFAFVYGDTRLEQLDINKVLSNQRILANYVKCLLEKGPCTSEGRELKERIPVALGNNCSDCSEKEKILIKKAARYVNEHNPQDFNNIVKHFDPEGKRKDQILKFIAAN